MKKVELIEVVHNDYDTSKSRNGGSYHQPDYHFTYEGTKGFLSDSSCGDFGGRFELNCGDMYAVWGDMLPADQQHSNLNVGQSIDISKALGVSVPSYEDLPEWPEWDEY